MEEFLTIQIEQELLTKILHRANEGECSVSELVRGFFEWIIKNNAPLDNISFLKRKREQPLDDFLKHIEKKEIQNVCKKASSKREAAEMLGITLRSFRYRFDQHQIESKF